MLDVRRNRHDDIVSDLQRDVDPAPSAAETYQRGVIGKEAGLLERSDVQPASAARKIRPCDGRGPRTTSFMESDVMHGQLILLWTLIAVAVAASMWLLRGEHDETVL